MTALVLRARSRGRLAALALLLLITACPAETAMVPLGDAGDEAFVRRLVPLMWGRNPISVREVDVLAQVLESTGGDRAGLVRAMAGSDEYVERWRSYLYDMLFVNRIGERSNQECFDVARSGGDSSELAMLVRDGSPESVQWPTAFSMRDLFRSSLILDDLSPIFRANLFAQLSRDFLMQGPEAATLLRQNSSESFESVYLNRQMACLPCHNSEWAVVDSPDPEQDRHWPLPGNLERALFDSEIGRPPEDVYGFFRRHGVLAGHNMFDIQYFSAPTGCFGRDAPGCDGCACEEVVCDQMPSCCTDVWTIACAEACSAAELGCIPATPENFDGCDPLPGHPGCAGCACEAEVCALHPDCCEFNWLNHCADFCTLLDPTCTFDDPPEYEPEGIKPWGQHSDCGIFVAPSLVEPDPLEVAGYFIEQVGVSASVWDLERMLHTGMEDLRDGRDIASDGSIGGEQAFAALVAGSVADKVWGEVFGSPLTVPNHFSRNEAQQLRLLALSERFSDSGWSLVELLAAIALDPLFNLPVPAASPVDASPYQLPAVFNPWVNDQEDEELRANSIGDIVHRKSGRVLVQTVTYALGLRALPSFPDDSEDVSTEARLQEDLGFRLKDSVHGFEGNDFQGLTSWEFAYGLCTVGEERVDGCGPRTTAGCDGCACEWAVCTTRPSCCDVRWDATCGGFCSASPEGCVPPDEPAEAPIAWIDRLVEAAADWDQANPETPATLGDAVAALRDRLLADPTMESDEVADLEALLAEQLSTPISMIGDLSQELRWACAALVASPQMQLAGDPGPDRRGTTTLLEVGATGFRALCERVSAELYGETLVCTDDSAAVPDVESR